MSQTDSQEYLAKKRFFDSLLTVYGRKPVLEALEQPDVKIHRLHLADSNKPAPILDQIVALAQNKGAEILHHSKRDLSRISKNTKQDQGVAADLICPGFLTLDTCLKQASEDGDLLALDGLTNPQNLGMIIRSACAGNIGGILLPRKGAAQIDPLVIKASAGTVFRAPIVQCAGSLVDTLQQCRKAGFDVVGLSSHATHTLSLLDHSPKVFVLGNETDGVSDSAQKACNHWVRIPMNRGVESLNVAVTAALIAFRGDGRR